VRSRTGGPWSRINASGENAGCNYCQRAPWSTSSWSGVCIRARTTRTRTYCLSRGHRPGTDRGGFRTWRHLGSAGAHHARAPPPLRRRDRPRPIGADCSTVSLIHCERVTRRSTAVRSRGRIKGLSAGGVRPSASRKILIQSPVSRLSLNRSLDCYLTVIMLIEIPHSVLGLGPGVDLMGEIQCPVTMSPR
jgi:hypothetical protein